MPFTKKTDNKMYKHRKHNIIWFNPTFNSNVEANKTNFLNLIQKDLTNIPLLNKNFKKNKIKISYSYTNKP